MHTQGRIFHNDVSFTSGCTDSDCKTWPVGSWFYSVPLGVTAFSGIEGNMSDTSHLSSQSLKFLEPREWHFASVPSSDFWFGPNNSGGL